MVKVHEILVGLGDDCAYCHLFCDPYAKRANGYSACKVRNVVGGSEPRPISNKAFDKIFLSHISKN